MFKNSSNHFLYWKFSSFIIFLYSKYHKSPSVSNNFPGEILDNCNQFIPLMVVLDIYTQIHQIVNLEYLLGKNYI